MLLFSFIAALICAALLGVAVLWLRHGSGRALDQARLRYEAFVADLDRRVLAGHADAAVAAEEKTEAARALLRVEAAGEAAPFDPRIGFVGALVIAGLGFGLYMVAGTPGLPDQPYAARLKAWTQTANRTPEALDAKPLAEVLKQRAADHGDDPDYWLMLGRIQVMAEDNYGAAVSFRAATKLSPQRAEVWSNLGEALTLFQKGQSGPEARAAFAKALTRNGNDLTALFYSAKILTNDGRFDEARRMFTRVMTQLAPDDGRRQAVAAELSALEETARTAGAVQAQIGGMVAGLEARLAEHPEDPDGWARLLRSYRVLKNSEGEKKTLAAIDRIYGERPEIARDILQKAEQPVGAQ